MCIRDSQQGARGIGLDFTRQRRLGTTTQWHDQFAAGTRSGQGRRQDAIHGTQLTGQAQLAQEFVFTQRIAIDLATGGEDAERNGKIEPTAILGQVGGRKIHGDAARGAFKLRTEDGGAHAITGFAYRRFRQAHDCLLYTSRCV